MSHVTMRELHERRVSAMSSDDRKVFDLAYRRAALAADFGLDDVEEPAAGRDVVPRAASGGTV